jgi:GNAT superfamily N-acetyltransferase
MVITFSVGASINGPRPINPNRDFPQLLQLLKVVFADEMDTTGRQVFESAAAGSNPYLLWRIDPFLSRLTPGFVWEENGRIVGNVTLIPTTSPRRYLVANVAIQTDYRRRGIARALMYAVQNEVKKRGGTEVHLQVEQDNEAAKALYASLGYKALGTLTTWVLLSSRHYAPPDAYFYQDNGVEVIKMPPSRWLDAYRLDMMSNQAQLNWPDPLQRYEYRNNFKRRITDFFKGKSFETWAVFGRGNDLQGLAAINSEWGRAHQLRVRVHPSKQGALESALLRKLLFRLQVMPRRQVRLLHDADDAVMNDLLPALRFRPDRSLTQMHLEL